MVGKCRLQIANMTHYMLSTLQHGETEHYVSSLYTFAEVAHESAVNL